MDDLDRAVERVLNGDPTAFRQIVYATSGQLVRLGARMLGSAADAEDVVQEAYLKAYRSLTTGKFDRRASVKTWLYRIVVNAAIDAKRSRAHRPEPTDVAMTSSFSDASSAEARLALVELEEWLRVLPEEQRVALTLSAVEGLSTGEIAAILECSEGAVEQRLVRARIALRRKREEP